MTTTGFKFMKSELIVITYLVLVIISISILLINTNLTNAAVICIDKYNQTNVIPCSDQNAIVRPNSQQANMNNTLTNATTNSSTTNTNPLAIKSSISGLPNNKANNQTSVTAGNSTINLKLGNKAYPIKYQLIGGKLNAISAEKDNITLLLNISSTSNGKLTIELPRYVIS